jgi:hypothetical protein
VNSRSGGSTSPASERRRHGPGGHRPPLNLKRSSNLKTSAAMRPATDTFSACGVNLKRQRIDDSDIAPAGGTASMSADAAAGTGVSTALRPALEEKGTIFSTALRAPACIDVARTVTVSAAPASVSGGASESVSANPLTIPNSLDEFDWNEFSDSDILPPGSEASESEPFSPLVG